MLQREERLCFVFVCFFKAETRSCCQPHVVPNNGPGSGGDAAEIQDEGGAC